MGKGLLFLIKKEAAVEFRNNRTFFITAVLCFIAVFSASYLAAFADLNADYGTVFWIAVFIPVFTGIDRIFRYEADRRSFRFLLHHYSVAEIMLSKFLFNSLMILSAETAAAAGCFLFSGFRLYFSLKIFPALFVAAAALSACTVFSALITSKSNSAIIFPLISLPLILPVLLLLVKSDVFSPEIFSLKEMLLLVFYGTFYLLFGIKLAPFVVRED